MYSILTTALFAGIALALPSQRVAARQDSTCIEDGQNAKEWTVENFEYRGSWLFTTPAHQVASGAVNFTLANDIVSYKPICEASALQLTDFFYGTVTYNCIMPEDAPSTDRATFTYSYPSGELRINQTWSCADSGAVFIGQGGTNLDLNCEEEEYQNPDWEMGETYSSRVRTCTTSSADATIEKVSAGL